MTMAVMPGLVTTMPMLAILRGVAMIVIINMIVDTVMAMTFDSDADSDSDFDWVQTRITIVTWFRFRL